MKYGQRNRFSSRLLAAEQLESRKLLAGMHMHGAFHGPAIISTTTLAASTTATSAYATSTSGTTTTSSSTNVAKPTTGTMLIAKLTDANSSEIVNIAYGTCTVNGTTVTRFAVQVNGAAANSTLSVKIGDVEVGTITTDSAGKGVLRLSSSPKGTNESALPDNFPTTVASGDAVSVGDLTGSLAAPAKPTKPTSPPEGAKGTMLGAKLSESTSGVTANVMFGTCTVNGTTVTRFAVQVSGATAGDTLSVKIGDVEVGTITVDSNGKGSLFLSSNPTKPNEVALPANFPTTVASGDAISVGTLSGTLATPTIRGRH